MHRAPAEGWISTLDHSDYCWRGWVRSPESVAEWISDLGHPDELVRTHAARALGQAGGAAKPAVARLEQLLADPKSAVRFAAAHALQQIAAGRPDRRAGSPRVGLKPWTLGVVAAASVLLGLLVLAPLVHALLPLFIHP
jgi:hypothetical protein